MDQGALIKVCKGLGCCDACCLRYLGLRNPNVYENPLKYLLKFEEQPDSNTTQIPPSTTKTDVSPTPAGPTLVDPAPADPTAADPTEGSTSPPHKRQRPDVCTSCLGLLQDSSLEQCCSMVKEMFDKNGYEGGRCACALSAPAAAALRETAVVLRLQAALPAYQHRTVTPLKEAWKSSLAPQLSRRAGTTLDSGAVCPLLVTVTMEYPDELQELEVLKSVSGDALSSRKQGPWSRRAVEAALEGVTAGALQRLAAWRAGPPAPRARAACVAVACAHAPVYLAGRYVKLSRALPQTPWLLNGARIMESSVQDIILEPLAELYKIPVSEAEHRLKFMSAGREDVDVRCLNHGRPFAVEICNPCRQPTADELARACERISASGSVLVAALLPVTREALSQLKEGENTKTKTYEALCIKLAHSDADLLTSNGDTPVAVTAADIERINTYRNTPEGEPARVVLAQRTPIRVLHRRPLLTRTRRILELSAAPVEAHPQLLVVRVRTEAGTYVKEWVHGDLRRTEPALRDALAAPVDILALDVAHVDLPWPPAPAP